MSTAVASRLDSICKRGGIRLTDIATMLNTRPETLSRWNSGQVDPQPEKFKKLAALACIIEELAEFYEPEDARFWLFTPHRLLGIESPADRIEGGDLESVLKLIRQLQDGAFV